MSNGPLTFEADGDKVSDGTTETSGSLEIEDTFTTTFNDLPEELKLNIFSYLTPKELCRYVAPVCREWRKKAHDPSLWKVLTLKHQKDDMTIVARFCFILAHATMLRSLTLRALSCPLQVLALCSASFPLLTNLDLGFCDGVDAHIISIFVRNCPLISSLNVEGCSGVEQKAIDSITTLKYLRSLNLSHCTFLNNTSIITIAEKCNMLQELNIDGITRITDSAVCVLCEKLQDKLRIIELDGEELTDSTFISLSHCHQLVKLGISFADLITDQSLIYLKKLPDLHHLKLRRGKQLTAPALKEIFSGRKLQHLTFLELDSLVIDDDGVRNMTECCSELRYLGLQWCWEITDEGLDSIISNCRKLEWLDLLGLYHIKGRCLLKIPSHTKWLRYLNVEQCNDVIDSVLRVLKRKVPSLTIKDYYGELVIPSSSSSSDAEEEDINEK